MPIPDITPDKSDEAVDSPDLTAWALRPIILFAAAYASVGILHEVVHAATAYALGVPSTLFHLYVNLEPSAGTLNERAVIRAAGPIFCLGLGLVCWFAYRRAKGSRAGLPLLYLAWFGVGTFFGNLMGTPFVGDFSGMAIAFGLSMPARYAAAIAGLVCISGLSFYLGTELRKWTPVDTGTVKATIGMIVLPVTLGTAIALLIFLPLPSADWAVSRVGESAFWIFAAVGTLLTRKQPVDDGRNLSLRWPDVAALLVGVAAIRLMYGGIALVP